LWDQLSDRLLIALPLIPALVKKLAPSAHRGDHLLVTLVALTALTQWESIPHGRL